MLLRYIIGGYDFVTIIKIVLYSIPALLIALSFHECAHAFAAYKLGDPTAKNLGRLSIDPFKHLDLLGTLMMLLFGFGWAKPVPINPRNFKKYRRDDIIVSLAGIVANLLTAFIFMGLLAIIQKNFTNDNEVGVILYTIVYIIIIFNISIAIFNILPIPPLDGYHVLKNIFAKLGPNFFWNYERYGQIILLLIVFSSAAGNIISSLSSGIFNLFAGIFGVIA